MANFVTGLTGLNISPWWVYIILGYIIAYLIWQFFAKTLISAYKKLGITSPLGRTTLMIICVSILFGFFGCPGFFNYGEISYFLSATSLLAIPGLIIALWPKREWVKRRWNDSNTLV